MAGKSGVMMRLIHERRFHALPGVEEFVRGLWRTTPLAICSGALRDEIEAMLEGVALRDCFSVIVAAEDVTVGKPDPRGIREFVVGTGGDDHGSIGTPGARSEVRNDTTFGVLALLWVLEGNRGERRNQEGQPPPSSTDAGGGWTGPRNRDHARMSDSADPGVRAG